jgi:hypothetical protein
MGNKTKVKKRTAEGNRNRKMTKGWFRRELIPPALLPGSVPSREVYCRVDLLKIE